MITTYIFEKIDNNSNLKYNVTYAPNEFTFTVDPYFTTIGTTYSSGTYSDAYAFKDTNHITVTMWDIYDMLNTQGIKVDLVVKGKETADLILPLVKTDSDYAYFSGNTLRLKVDSSGSVTEYSDVT